MEVQLRPPGCLHRLGTALSFGLLPVLLRSQQTQYPASLSEDSMILRSGVRIPWSAFKRYRATELYVRGIHMNTQYELWHSSGRVYFAARQIEDPDAVVRFILAHLPPEAMQAGPRDA